MSPHQALSKYSIAIIWQFDGAARRVRFVLRCERHGRDVFVCRRGMGRVCRGTQSVLRKGKTEMKKNLSIFFFALLFAPLFSQAQGWGSITGLGNGLQVDTSTSTLRQVIEQQRISELPLNGRNAAQLTLLVAGAVNSPNGGADQGATKTFPGAVTFSANGSRQNSISYQ